MAHLRRLGYAILERNVRFRVGEIDIVAREGEQVVFVEVKTRRSGRFGLPEEAITGIRYQHIALAAATYLSERGWDCAEHRIDVVGIEVDANGRVRRCNVIQGVQPPG